MEQLIPIASKLQDVLGALGQSTALDLPQIVVVGGQSSGKSSVLEGIVGRSFLPRGHGIVTRRPLVLQLYNTAGPSGGMGGGGGGADGEEDSENLNPNETSPEDGPDEGDGFKQRRKGRSALGHSAAEVGEGAEWGEFLHLPGRRFGSFRDLRAEISRDTERLVGKNKGINPTPIYLKIYSPKVLNLTLVDLPGIAKVAVGDQPEDIEEQIRSMCLQYISNPNAIILAVTCATHDLANSDALKMARQVDPNGDRTVGVVTKLDLMDPGTDASDILHNKVVPLRRGYVGVVNRGQIDVDSDLSIRDGLSKEAKFFRNHPVYGHDRALVGRIGTKNLTSNLNSILMHHIRECLPELKNRIGSMLCDVQAELDDLGTAADATSRSTLGGALLGLLSKFASNFASTIDGRGTGNLRGQGVTSKAGGGGNVGLDELYGGARISYIFSAIFANSLMSVGSFDGLSDEEIRTTICNANGTRPALFVPEISFDILARRQIGRLEQPGVQCVDLVYEELQRISTQSEPGELTRFPVLRDRMMEVVSNLLKRAMGPTQIMVQNLVKIELAYINTSHPDFIGGSKAVARLMTKMAQQKDVVGRSQVPPVSQGGSTDDGRGRTGTAEARGGGSGRPGDEGSIYAMDGTVLTPRDREDREESTGIMNFIFRGNNAEAGAPPPVQNVNTSNQTPFSPPFADQGGTAGFGTPLQSHPSVMGGYGGPPSIVQLPRVPSTMRQTDVPPTDRERVEVEIIKSLIESYFGIVRKNFIDMVPKTIMYFLVNHVRDALQNELVSELYREAEIQSLMAEASDVAHRRKTCVEMKDLLSKALEIVNEVRDFNTFNAQ
jgi:dynamin 1-like protein